MQGNLVLIPCLNLGGLMTQLSNKGVKGCEFHYCEIKEHLNRNYKLKNTDNRYLLGNIQIFIPIYNNKKKN